MRTDRIDKHVVTWLLLLLIIIFYGMLPTTRPLSCSIDSLRMWNGWKTDQMTTVLPLVGYVLRATARIYVISIARAGFGLGFWGI